MFCYYYNVKRKLLECNTDTKLKLQQGVFWYFQYNFAAGKEKSYATEHVDDSQSAHEF